MAVMYTFNIMKTLCNYKISVNIIPIFVHFCSKTKKVCFRRQIKDSEVTGQRMHLRFDGLQVFLEGHSHGLCST